ncbi:MAG TPA: heme o synthase [Candidatus Dormibacteraeota bacterium]|nr:heme o synthase [Candidatus Dormibacteraeota bacterium]
MQQRTRRHDRQHHGFIKAAQLLIQTQHAPSLNSKIQTYYEFTKPKIWYLLVFTSLTSTFIATRLIPNSFSILGWILAGAAITAGCAGCNSLTNYHDRDIDAVMMRTRHRPLPSGRISPTAALRFALGLIAISLIFSALLNLVSLLWMSLGILDNVGVYSFLLKRRSPLNILLGGFSGGLPVLFGWSAVTPGILGSLPLARVPILMAGLVFVWIPVHIWFLAVSNHADYSRANIPMLPVVVQRSTALRLITLFSLIMVPVSLALYLWGYFGLIYGVVALVGSLANLIGSFWALYRPTESNAWRMFKLSSPYLFLLFVAMIIDVALTH